MGTKTGNYKYLLQLYSSVSEYLGNNTEKSEDLPWVVVAFCIFTEKLFKIRLYKKNPVLVYENSKMKEDDALISIIKNKESNIETIRIRETINRYKMMFNNDFTDDEMQVLIDIYNVRNHFVHGYKPDDEVLSEKENIVKKMGTVWEKISTQAVAIFGDALIKANKPKKKYSEEELEKVLTEEVKKKIQPIDDYNPRSLYARGSSVAKYLKMTNYSPLFPPINSLREQCPRCGSFNFSLDGIDSDILSTTSCLNFRNLGETFSDLYKCGDCNLELTRKEYEIAKKLKS